MKAITFLEMGSAAYQQIRVIFIHLYKPNFKIEWRSNQTWLISVEILIVGGKGHKIYDDIWAKHLHRIPKTIWMSLNFENNLHG